MEGIGEGGQLVMGRRYDVRAVHRYTAGIVAAGIVRGTVTPTIFGLITKQLRRHVLSQPGTERRG